MAPETGDAATRRAVQRFTALFPSVDPVIVTGVVLDSYRLYVHHPNPDFVPVLVEEAARDRLRGHLEACSIRGGSPPEEARRSVKGAALRP